jgi:bifunctional non-homologous end joining protein LigD
VGKLMLPFAAGRPLNLFRCPDGKCLFQRHENHPAVPQGTFGPAIGRLPIRQKNGKTEHYLHVEDLAGILACVEAETVEFHGWGSRIADVERPDRIVIDLDPDEGLPFALVKNAAMLVRERLSLRQLESYALLTGGKGIHVVVPIEPEREWDEVREWSRQFCTALAEERPWQFTAQVTMAQRRGRIFLDYLRNQRASTAVLPWSARARDGAPVAVPVSWEELAQFETARPFTIRDWNTLLQRGRRAGMRKWGTARQSLSRAIDSSEPTQNTARRK